MLNGQLPLTDLNFAQAPSRLSRVTRLAGVFSLVLLAGCSFNKNRAPVVDLSNQPASTQAGGTYVVKPGDTLYQIARANNVDVNSLKRWNNINDPNQISVGQVLQLSGSATAAATPAATPSPAPVAESKPIPLGEPETPPNSVQ
ncbi:M23 family metallopeptidase, partial [Bordetella petrii]|uniref:M23 family metallopeptidase n=1 Tax=Bordetella petrii TaxID=94624 RepID=UPI001E4AC9AB